MHTKRLLSIFAFSLLLNLTLSGFGSNLSSQQVEPAYGQRQMRQAATGQSLLLRDTGTLRTGAVSRSLAQPLATLPVTNRIGFLAASQNSPGDWSWGETVVGDFNGDSKKDLVTFVSHFDSGLNSFVNSLSVVTGNNDGTFNPAVLTQINTSANPDFMTLCVADLNGDHKDDVVVLHDGEADVFVSSGGGHFSAPTTFALGGNVVGAALLVLQGDSTPDLMVVTDNSTMLIARGTGSGTFQNPTTVAFSGILRTAVITDLNGDGNPDIAAIDDASGAVEVFLAGGTGGFELGTRVDQDGAPCALEAGDLNKDGKPELVAADCNRNGNGVTIFVNNGDGTFSRGVSYWSGFHTRNVAITDVNGDGNNDIVAVNDGSGDVTVLKGNGDGTVVPAAVGDATGGVPCANSTEAVPGASGAAPCMPVVADFNGDGKPDVIVSDNEFSLVYLQGYGNGTFRAAHSYYGPLATGDSIHVPWTTSLASGDFDKDGNPDIVAGNMGNATVGVTVFLSNKDGSLKPGVNYGADSLQFVAVEDFDGDGNQDIAASSASDYKIHVFRGQGDGTFGTDVAYGSGTHRPEAIVAADLNHDGKPDLAAITADGNVVVMLNDGSGGFAPEATYPLSGAGTYLVAANVTGNNPDLIAVDSVNGEIDILPNNGDGTFGSYQSITVGGTLFDVAVADANGDGKLDMAVTLQDGGAGSVLFLQGNGDGTFQAPVSYPATLQDTSLASPNPQQIRIVDLDGDGHQDLVWTNSEYGTVGVYYGKADGTFDGPYEFPTGSHPNGLVILDMNGDGAPDAVTADGANIAPRQPTPTGSMLGVTVLLNAGGSKVTLASDANPANYGQTVTLTATVSPTVSGVSGVPSGSVVFQDGGTSLGTAPLSAGVATQTLTTLAPGSHSITATYSGDTAFLPSSASITQTVGPASPPDYTLAPTPASATITSGGSATFTITATADEYFNGTVSFSCGQVPKGVTCGFNPVSLSPTSGHPATTTLTVTTTALTADLAVPAFPGSGTRGVVFLASLGGIGVFGGLLLGDFSRRKRLYITIFAALVVIALLGMTACGGGSTPAPTPNPNGTPLGQSTVEIAATATAGTTGGNTTTHTISVTINVQ